jgi:hypothetical protein
MAGALVVLLASAAAAAAQPPGPAVEDTKTLNLAAYAELLRSDVRTQKIALLTELIGLSDAEDKVFWPLYRDFDAEMAKLGDERVRLIAEYAANYSQLTDAVADKLATTALELEARRQAAKAKHFARIKNALSARTALRFLQIEQQLLLIIDLQISAALPVAQ